MPQLTPPAPLIVAVAVLLTGWARPEFVRGQNGAAPPPTPDLRANRVSRLDGELQGEWRNSGYTTDPTAPHRFPSWRTLGNPLNGALIVKAVHRFTP